MSDYLSTEFNLQFSAPYVRMVIYKWEAVVMMVELRFDFSGNDVRPNMRETG
jgi:hypothetical protein